MSSKRKIPVCFNRKEIKDHGEGGSLIGASPKGKILIVDDVLSSGLAIRESIEILKPFDTEIVGVLVALNRQERGQESDQMAAEELRESGIPIFEIVSLDDMIGSKNVISNKDLELMNEYRKITEVPMFSGIIQEIGIVEKISAANNIQKIQIKCTKGFLKNLKVGDSVSVDGVCLTVVKFEKEMLFFDVIEETISRSIIKEYKIGAKVNLETL